MSTIKDTAFSADIPFDKMYQASRKEANRKKPVFFVHKYFARRITANFRMALLGFLSKPEDDIFTQIYSASEKRSDVTVLDPFMGGGTTIFEALRFGCKVIGNDLQPLSLFVTKALVKPVDEKAVNEEVKRLEQKVGNRIKSYYKTKCPCCGKPANGMYAFHVKKVLTDSECKEHRLFSSFIIAYKKDEFTVVCPKCGKLSKTKFDGGRFTCDCGWELSSPKESFVENGVFRCPICGETKALSEYGSETGYPFSTDIVAIEYYCPHCGAHDYKAPDDEDFALYEKAVSDYEKMAASLPIPKQHIPSGYNTNQILNHGYKKFSDLFNPRQLLCLGMLLEEINKVQDKEVQFWLQLAFSGMLEMNNMFCRYQQNAFKICNIFFNHAYVPIAMPVENCVWGAKLGTGTFDKTISKILRGKHFNNNIYDNAAKKTDSGKYDSIQVENSDCVNALPVTEYSDCDEGHPLLRCSDSRNLEFIPDESVDLVLTDPPYGANVMYSELIDFFHVWNSLSSIASEIGFKDSLSPKENEIIINSVAGKDIHYYQNGITAVLSECYKKLRQNGCLVFSFHDKSIESWMAVLESIFEAGFELKKSFPVQSETRTGAHTSNKNSIGIDIMLVCKKKDKDDAQLEFLNEESLRKAILDTKADLLNVLDRFQKVEAELTLPDIQNIVIADFFSKIKGYSSYDEAAKGKIITELQALLNGIEEIAGDFEITKKRNGWWSELYREKWNLVK
jgi:putative DNA methylase